MRSRSWACCSSAGRCSPWCCCIGSRTSSSVASTWPSCSWPNRARPAQWLGKFFLIPFFLVHFGGFTYIHGVLVVAFFGPKGTQPFDLLTAVPAAIRANQLGWGVLGLVASHGLSFYWNYLKSGEYERASLNALMSQPYGRVMVLHMTVLLGGWVVMLLGSPLFALVLLVVLKTAADWRAHQAERRKFGA